MKLIRHCHELPDALKGAVVALGNFDGVHKGHQAVIRTALDQAAALGVPTIVMTFEPHPRAFFNVAQPAFRLTPFRVKARLIQAMGVDVLYCQHFDTAFSQMTADAFILDILIGGLRASHVVVGYDYVFGKGRQGTGALLQKMADLGHFGFTAVPPATTACGETYSSTRVREYLAQGQTQDAARLLGHYWEMENRVDQGDQRGRTIGFPTANLALDEYLRPAFGVYAVRAGLDMGGATQWMDGVANLGRRPTFDKTDEVLEVHLLGRTIDLYGRHLRVALIEHIRPEQRFSGLDALKAQILADAQQARAILSKGHFSDTPGPMVGFAQDPESEA